jgi:hypothetical protein
VEFSKAIILDTAYGYEPMMRELAEAIRESRCNRRLAYEEVPKGLNEGFGCDFALGKDLCVKAKGFLNEKGDEWE